MKQLRGTAGLSQEEVASRANLNRTYLADLEAGKHEPGSYRLVALAQVYGLTFAQLAALIENRAVRIATAARQRQERMKRNDL